MRVVENTADRMILKGIPGRFVWMIFTLILGLTVMAVAGGFAWITVRETDSYLSLIPLCLGILMGLAFFLIGLMTLTWGRVSLKLDRVEGTAHYEVFSPVIDVGKPCSFSLDKIDSVTIERTQETRHGSEHGSFPAKVCRARLRVRKPRRTIILDETQNGNDRRVTETAEAVAKWLNLQVSQTTKLA